MFKKLLQKLDGWKTKALHLFSILFTTIVYIIPEVLRISLELPIKPLVPVDYVAYYNLVAAAVGIGLRQWGTNGKKTPLIPGGRRMA